MRITEDIKYVGVNDHKIDLFEGQYIVPNGMSYNSYVILDEKIAVLDSVDAAFRDEWLANQADADRQMQRIRLKGEHLTGKIYHFTRKDRKDK